MAVEWTFVVSIILTMSILTSQFQIEQRSVLINYFTAKLKNCSGHPTNTSCHQTFIRT